MLPLDTIVATATAGTKIRRSAARLASRGLDRVPRRAHPCSPIPHPPPPLRSWPLTRRASTAPARAASCDWARAFVGTVAGEDTLGEQQELLLVAHRSVGRRESHIYYRDRSGKYNEEYLSLGVDKLPLLHGRTAAQCYTDVLKSFTTTFLSYLGTTINEITIGLGPAGELRYPAYPEGDGRWHFPGIGEFQCYDKYMLEDLKKAADACGRPEWGLGGPHDAGHYKSLPWETRFFEFESGTFASEYGHFFLDWYSRKLIDHADLVLGEAAKQCWAVAVNDIGQDELVGCVEMHDSEHPEHCYCSPQGLLWQMRCTAQRANIPLSGENALQRYDEAAFERILHNTYSFPAPLRTFTFLRMGEALFAQHNWSSFVHFVQSMCSAAQAGPAEQICSVTTSNCRGDLCSV
eukprot:SM000312S11996  [mRNA]  locus=s312:30665:33875:- [translate_table: standard]